MLLPERQTVASLADDALAGPYHARLGLTLSAVGMHDEASADADRARECAARAGDAVTLGRAQEGLADARQAVALLERTDEPLALGQACRMLGANHFLLGEFTAALQAQAQDGVPHGAHG